MRWAAVLLLVAASCAQPRAAGSDGAIRALDGTAVSAAELQNGARPTLLVFMASWCDACRQEQPAVERFARAFAEDVRTVYVLSGTSVERARALATARKIRIEMIVDEAGQLARDLGVTAVPTLLLYVNGEQMGAWTRVEDVRLPGRESLRAVVDEGEELGTTYHVEVLASDEDAARSDLAAARARCRALEARFSEWRRDSEISRLNRRAAAGPVEMSDAMRRLLVGALHVTRETKGAFDITWRPLGALWDDAVRRGAPPGADERAAALAAVGPRHVRIEGRRVRFAHPRTRIGIAGMAKGWIIDDVHRVLRRAGYRSVIVNIGGDLRTAGRDQDGKTREFRVPDPYRPRQVACSLVVEDVSMATSGNYFRYREIAGRRYGHILDPRTGAPPEFDGSVTVLTRDAAMADALATALFVMGPDAGLAYVESLDGVEALFVTRDGIRSTLPRGAFAN